MNNLLELQSANYKHFSAFVKIAILFVVLLGKTFAGSLTLSWDASTSSKVGGYKIYYGTSSKNYTKIVDAGNVTSFDVTNLTEGTTYYFAVKTYNTTETSESAFSSEVFGKVPVSTTLSANFTANKTSGIAPLAVQFTAVTTGPVTGWNWDFGDPSIPNSTRQNPAVTFSTAGTYDVRLTVTGSAGRSATRTKVGYITVSAPTTPPVANFSATPLSGNAPLTVNFNNNSTGNITSRTWNFGDGATSTAVNPSHVYSAIGDYTVKLTVSGPSGSDSKTSIGLIHVTAPVSTGGKGLVAAYNFEEISDSIIADASGKNNHGVLREALRTALGRFGRALKFDGVNDWISVPDSISLSLGTGFTLEAWVKPESLGPQTIISKESATGSVYNLYASDSNDLPSTSLHNGTAYQILTGTSALPVNQWAYLTSTYDGKKQRLFINGKLIAETAQTGAVINSMGLLRIGGSSIWGDFFDGYIDEVRIYNRALTQTEIATDFKTAIKITKPRKLVLGDGTLASKIDSNPQGTAEAYRTTATKNGVITAIRVYIDASSTATEIVTGIYDNNSGRPGKLLGQVKSKVTQDGTWVQIPIPTVKVTAGKTYWIAILGSKGQLKFRDRLGSGTAPLITSAQKSLTNLPNTWTTGSVYPDDGPISLYGAGY